MKRSWTDGEIIDAFLRAWDRLKSGEELTFRRYTALHETDKQLPGTNTLRWGSRPGFAFYRDRSREIRLAVLATA